MYEREVSMYYTDNFHGYDIDKPLFCLTEHEYNILYNAISFIENHYTIRQLAKECCRSRSQLSRDFQELKYLSDDLYERVQKQIEENMKRFRR